MSWIEFPPTADVEHVCEAALCIHIHGYKWSGAVSVTRTSTNTCNSVAIKNVNNVNILKYLKCIAKVYSTIADNVIYSC